MNKLIRGFGRAVGVVGADDDTSSTTQEPASRDTAATTEADQQPEQITLTRAEYDAQQREWQSRKDREVNQARLDLTRNHAKERAEAGDLAPIRSLAEKGDRWALQQLEQQGDTWALGEIKQAELAQARAMEGMTEQVTGLAVHFDQAYLEPLLAALPDQAEADKLRASTVGIDGRTATTQAVLASLKKHWQAEASTKLLGDEAFVRQALGDTTFRREMLKNPVVNKQLRAYFRGDLNEPDLNPGTGPGRGGERESDVMNDAIRGAWRGAELRGDDESAAMAGGRNGRLTNRDVLDDDRDG